MIVPPFLVPGNTIALVAPAKKIATGELQPAIDILVKRGFKVREGKHLYGSDHQFSGSDEQRLQDLQEALDAEDVHAILCARGGYGTMRIMDQLSAAGIKKNPKWVIGYSDITALHLWLHEKAGICSIHGPMARNFTEDPAPVHSLLELLSGHGMRTLQSPASVHQIEGKASGLLTGGNISMLYALKGSSTIPGSRGKIVMLEDLDEYLYHIDRMMVGLKRSGYFNGCRGVLVGGLTDMRDNTISFGKDAETIVKEHLMDLEVPIAFNVRFGHIPGNYPMVMHAKVHMEVSKEGSNVFFDGFRNGDSA